MTAWRFASGTSAMPARIEGRIQARHIRRVVLVVVNFHGFGVNVGFQRVEGIAEGRQYKGRTRLRFGDRRRAGGQCACGHGACCEKGTSGQFMIIHRVRLLGACGARRA
jgi:hypothetical protein